MPGMMRVVLGGLVLSAAIAAVPDGNRVLTASASGPVPAQTGGFGEMTCHQCHWDNPLNDTPGRISLSGVPDTYTPGERYPITVSIAHPELVKAGFQMSARFEDGKNAGLFRSPDRLTESIPDDGGRITYIQHTISGSAPPTKGESRWNVEWTAPAEGGAVVFHLAGNASNGDLSPLGDFIYTASTTSRRR
jgi:hypothetical protein